MPALTEVARGGGQWKRQGLALGSLMAKRKQGIAKEETREETRLPLLRSDKERSTFVADK